MNCDHPSGKQDPQSSRGLAHKLSACLASLFPSPNLRALNRPTWKGLPRGNVNISAVKHWEVSIAEKKSIKQSFQVRPERKSLIVIFKSFLEEEA